MSQVDSLIDTPLLYSSMLLCLVVCVCTVVQKTLFVIDLWFDHGNDESIACDENM